MPTGPRKARPYDRLRIKPRISRFPDAQLRIRGLVLRTIRNDGEPASGFREQLVDILPVHQVIDPRLQIIRPAIAIIDVVGVLPDVDAEDRGGAMNQRVLSVGRLGNLELAVLHRQPRPPRTELADAGGGEIGLEFLEPAKVLGDLLLQAAR